MVQCSLNRIEPPFKLPEFELGICDLHDWCDGKTLLFHHFFKFHRFKSPSICALFWSGTIEESQIIPRRGPFVGSDWSRKTQVFHFSPSSEVDQKVERISNPADSWPAWKSGCGKWDPSFFEGVSNLWPLGGGFNFLLKDFHPDLWGNDLRFVKGEFLRMLPR